MMSFFHDALHSSWTLLNQSAVYMLFGLLIGGLLKEYLSPSYVANHLGSGRFSSVFKAALLGIPIPLCSCGVLPAAATLKKQGADNGAVTAFLISTPESGVDSISITWALLDPIMTVARPLSAFISAVVAGTAENLFSFSDPDDSEEAAQEDFDRSGMRQNALAGSEGGCCSGCSDIESDIARKPQEQRFFIRFPGKLKAGIHYATVDIWEELAGWFFVGILLAGIITVLVPDEMIAAYLGGGLSSMFVMLLLGIPLYICATASTPIAAAFIMKGVSPGTALVFLLVGPATNITSLSVLVGLLGKRAAGLYLLSIAVVSVLCGLAVDAVYNALGISAVAAVARHGDMLPDWLMLAATAMLIALSVRPLKNIVYRWFRRDERCGCSDDASDGDNTKKNL
jgi:uncharacterized membrane protein YraQ (UPF0718 family)